METIDWPVILTAAGGFLAFGLNYAVLNKLAPDEGHEEVRIIRAFTISVTAILGLLVEPILLYGLYKLALAILDWGIGNTILLLILSAAGLAIPIFGRSLLFKVPLLTWHGMKLLAKSFVKDVANYHEELEGNSRSIEPYHWR